MTTKNFSVADYSFTRNIASLFTGNIFTFSVFWLIQINLSWLAYQLTNSSFLLGFLGFMVNIPMLFLIVTGGVLSDIWSRKKIMIACQLLYLLPNLALFAMIYTHHITYWTMVAVGLMYGGLFGFAKPSADATVFDISRNDKQLKIGVSLNSSTSQVALLFTPFISKWVIQLFGLPSVFILCTVANLIAFTAFSTLNIKQSSPLESQAGIKFFNSIKLALLHIKENKLLSIFIMMVSLSLGLIISLQFQFPAIIKSFVAGTKFNLYRFYFFSALGALCGASFILLRRYSRKTAFKILTAALILQSFAVIGLSLSRHLLSCYFMVFFIAAFGMIATITGTIAIQQTVENEKRGRVLSLLEMTRIGAIPVMSFIIGVMMALLGIFYGLLIFGVGYFIVILLFRYYSADKIAAVFM